MGATALIANAPCSPFRPRWSSRRGSETPRSWVSGYSRKRNRPKSVGVHEPCTSDSWPARGHLFISGKFDLRCATSSPIRRLGVQCNFRDADPARIFNGAEPPDLGSPAGRRRKESANGKAQVNAWLPSHDLIPPNVGDADLSRKAAGSEPHPFRDAGRFPVHFATFVGRLSPREKPEHPL